MQAAPDADLGSLPREQLKAEVRCLRVHAASSARMFEQAPSFIMNGRQTADAGRERCPTLMVLFVT